MVVLGNKPLPEPVLAQIYVATRHHWAPMSWWHFKHPIDITNSGNMYFIQQLNHASQHHNLAQKLIELFFVSHLMNIFVGLAYLLL